MKKIEPAPLSIIPDGRPSLSINPGSATNVKNLYIYLFLVHDEAGDEVIMVLVLVSWYYSFLGVMVTWLSVGFFSLYPVYSLEKSDKSKTRNHCFV